VLSHTVLLLPRSASCASITRTFCGPRGPPRLHAKKDPRPCNTGVVSILNFPDTTRLNLYVKLVA
jgi:hypothetical protein